MALHGRVGGGGRVRVTLVTEMGKAKLPMALLQLHFMSQGLIKLLLRKVS